MHESQDVCIRCVAECQRYAPFSALFSELGLSDDCLWWLFRQPCCRRRVVLFMLQWSDNDTGFDRFSAENGSFVNAWQGEHICVHVLVGSSKGCRPLEEGEVIPLWVRQGATSS